MVEAVIVACGRADRKESGRAILELQLLNDIKWERNMSVEKICLRGIILINESIYGAASTRKGRQKDKA